MTEKSLFGEILLDFAFGCLISETGEVEEGELEDEDEEISIAETK